jgi:hypothetical protein
MHTVWFEKLAVALAMILGAVLAVLAVQSWFPAEKAPARHEVPDGRIEFVIQSRREAAYWPAGAMALPLSGLLWLHVSRCIRGTSRHEDRKVHPWLRPFYYVLMAFLAFLFVKVVLLDPLFRYRAITLDRNGVRMDSLYRTWSLPLGEIAGTCVEREDVERKGDVTDLTYSVRNLDGNKHRSVTITCPRPSPELSNYVKFLGDMDTEIKKGVGQDKRGAK